MLNYLSQQLIFGLILLLPMIHFLIIFFERQNLKKIKLNIISLERKKLIRKDILLNQLLSMFIIVFISLIAVINLVVTTSPALQETINGEVSQGIVEETYNNEFDYEDLDDESITNDLELESSSNNTQPEEERTIETNPTRNPKLNSNETNTLLVILFATSLLTCFVSIMNITNIKHAFISPEEKKNDTEVK